jgi:hypothetical protein
VAASRKLKVFRTAVGFHDAYVAAPSRKAALEAWGSDRDLFRIGAAEQITDEALMREPLARPGEVVKRRRGTTAENVAALPGRSKARAKQPARQPPARPLPPRPSRKALDEAEAAMKSAEAERDAAIGALDEEAAALARKRQRLVREWKARISTLDRRCRAEHDKHLAAMDRWRNG